MPEETSFVEYVVQKYWDDEGPNGAFILHLHDIIIDNPLEEDFVEYDSLEEWRDHLDLHNAPGDVYEILEDLWREYEREVPETLRVEVSRICRTAYFSRKAALPCRYRRQTTGSFS